jgi:bifunctional UDP-N-acetylglucosamine pyrophosphorylase/glucosamine-1-phosphate N-acetyltransferase
VIKQAIVLAAGEGTRMKSQTPKVLHSIAGRSLLGHVLHALDSVNPETVRVVVGSGREKVEAHLSEIAPDAIAIFQAERNGTGHAVQVALDGVKTNGNILILAGDTPLLSGNTLKEFVAAHNDGGYTASRSNRIRSNHSR